MTHFLLLKIALGYGNPSRRPTRILPLSAINLVLFCAREQILLRPRKSPPVGSVRISRLNKLIFRVFFKSAINILKDCESQAGAVARSYFSLALTLEESGLFDEMEEAKVQLHICLKGVKGLVNNKDLTEDFFQQFVLFCHQ